MQKTILAAVLSITLVAATSAKATTIIPAGFTNLSVDTLPSTTTSFGDAVYDSSGDAYITSRSTIANKVFKISPGGPGGTVTTFLTLGSSDPTGLAIDGNTLYLSQENGVIQKVVVTDAVPTLSPVTTLVGLSSLTDIAFAPPNSPFAGDLIYSGINGERLGRLNLTTLLTAQIGATISSVSAIAFAPDGDLVYLGGGFAREFSGGSEITIGSAGFTGAEQALAIHPGTGQIFVGNSSSNILSTLSGGVLTTFATSIDFDSGFFQDPLTFTPDGTGLLYAEGEGSSSVFVISGFSSTVPEPTTLTLAALSLLALAYRRRNRA